ncbi:MAG: hypothetical protein AB1551_08995 [Actinomycetota bacterium]
MAIKGRGKSKARKAVTSGPRPTYVPVKRPLLARRGFQITALVLVAGLAVGGISYGLAKERTKQREEELAASKRAATTRYQSAVEAALSKVGGQVSASAFSVLPVLQRDLDWLRTGDIVAESAARDAAGAARSAKRAAADMTKIRPARIFGSKGFGPGFVRDGLNSHAKMLNALKLYETAARLLEMAANTDADEQSELLDRASGVLDVASTLFDDGYGDYLNVLWEAGLFAPSAPTGSGG